LLAFPQGKSEEGALVFFTVCDKFSSLSLIYKALLLLSISLVEKDNSTTVGALSISRADATMTMNRMSHLLKSRARRHHHTVNDGVGAKGSR
jgi:hypothetical protein